MFFQFFIELARDLECPIEEVLPDICLDFIEFCLKIIGSSFLNHGSNRFEILLNISKNLFFVDIVVHLHIGIETRLLIEESSEDEELHPRNRRSDPHNLGKIDAPLFENMSEHKTHNMSRRLDNRHELVVFV